MTENPDDTRKGLLRLSCAALVLVFIAACGSTSSRSGSEPDTSKYDQRWPQPYSETTCRHWNNQMTDQQRWAAAADMLTGARNKGDGGEGLPPDALVNEFRDGITTACVEPSMTLADVGAGLYVTERSRFAP